MNILLTGATGFIGKHLVKKLVENNYNVIALVRRSSDTNPLKKYNINIHFIEDGLENFFINNTIDGIIHAATTYGQNGCVSEVYNTNVIFPIQLLELSVKYGVLFFINTDTFFTKSIHGYSYLNNYTNSKKLVVELSKQFSSKLCIINLKLEHVYGENDGEKKFITQIIKRLASNETSIDLTSGLQKRDFIYILDVIDGYLTVLENIMDLKGFTNIEIGTGKAMSIREAVVIIHSKTKSTSKLNFGVLPIRSGEFEESKANSEILKKMGWDFKYNFEQGITRILEQEKLNTYGTN